jgi:hypothetical protein
MVTELTEEAVAAPVPFSGTTTGLALALVMMVREPFTVPAEVAPNMTVKFLLWPAEREKGGGVKPDMVKPAPAMLTWLTLKAAVPELVAVTLCVEPEVPTVLFRETLLGVTVSCAVPGGAAGFAGVLATPAHPEIETVARRIARRKNTRSGPRFSREECI